MRAAQDREVGDLRAFECEDGYPVRAESLLPLVPADRRAEPVDERDRRGTAARPKGLDMVLNKCIVS